MYLRNPSPFSSPSVRLFGVVVSVIRDEPIIRKISLITINTAVLRPSCVIVSFHILIRGVPGVRNRLNAALITINITIALRPLTMNLRGIFDSAITIAKNAATTRYSHILLPRNRDITNIKVPISLTLGSSLCITESA